MNQAKPPRVFSMAPSRPVEALLPLLDDLNCVKGPVTMAELMNLADYLGEMVGGEVPGQGSMTVDGTPISDEEEAAVDLE